MSSVHSCTSPNFTTPRGMVADGAVERAGIAYIGVHTRCACTARVMVVAVSVCLSVCLSVC